MSDFLLSKHALEQIELRNLTVSMVEAVLLNPDVIIEEMDGQLIYQSIIQRDSKNYLLRVFVNSHRIPNLVKTVYLTSKISKYE